MNRRGFLRAGCSCAAFLLPAAAAAQSAWHAPARFSRPDIETDEGGIWALMDREETRLRRSPFVLRDRALRDYVQSIACRLAGSHCPDVRVYLVRTPVFNANMAPNGMMQVWTGLMLRIENEAQLAAVLGHEIGHYLERHSLERLRDIKSRSAFAQFLGLFGLVGAIGQIAAIAGAFAYSRDHERAADEIGARLMRDAGYDPAAAGRVWENLLLELKARPDGDPSQSSPLFASHPPAEERKDALNSLARSMPGGAMNEGAWQRTTRPFLAEWLGDEIKRGRHDESLALLNRLAAHAPSAPEYPWARGEVYRLRAGDADHDAAIADFQRSIALGGGPPEAHRGLGMIQRLRGVRAQARESFQRYLALAPSAPDSAFIQHYIEELGP